MVVSEKFSRSPKWEGVHIKNGFTRDGPVGFRDEVEGTLMNKSSDWCTIY